MARLHLQLASLWTGELSTPCSASLSRWLFNGGQAPCCSAQLGACSALCDKHVMTSIQRTAGGDGDTGLVQRDGLIYVYKEVCHTFTIWRCGSLMALALEHSRAVWRLAALLFVSNIITALDLSSFVPFLDARARALSDAEVQASQQAGGGPGGMPAGWSTRRSTRMWNDAVL